MVSITYKTISIVLRTFLWSFTY